MLRTGSRVFLLVRFVVGTTLIPADVRDPFTGAVPYAGQRIWIRTDPTAPARVLFDSNRNDAPSPPQSRWRYPLVLRLGAARSVRDEQPR